MKKKKEKFQMEITGKYKDAWTGQANEAVRIFSRSGQELLNSKSEFNQPPLARIVIEKKLKFGRKYQDPNWQKQKFEVSCYWDLVNIFNLSTEQQVLLYGIGIIFRINSSEQENTFSKALWKCWVVSKNVCNKNYQDISSQNTSPFI